MLRILILAAALLPFSGAAGAVTYYVDFAGTPISQGKAPDIGAFEWKL